MSRTIANTGNTHISDSEWQLRNTNAGKLLFTEYNGHMCSLLIKDNRLIAASVLPKNPSKIGAIYIGKVKNVVSNLNACFVEIADGEMCFLSLKDAVTPYITNRTFDGRIVQGDELLVQITRDAQKTKLASVTAHVSVSNDAFVISQDYIRTGYSGKLSKAEKERLRSFLSKYQLPSTGLILRTLAKDYTEEELLLAYESLKEQFNQLLQAAQHKLCYSCLQSPAAAFENVLEHLVYPYEYEEIVTDHAALYEQLSNYCVNFLPDKSVRFYEDAAFPLQKLYSLSTKLDTALNTRVWLKSGAYLVIEPTEALTVIDVNSGKYDAKKSSTEAMYRINLEAAEEIALQLRLRNLSGIILIDFINMNSQEYQLTLLEELRQMVRKDKIKTIVVDITPLGLVEITRKKTNPTLIEQFKE